MSDMVLGARIEINTDGVTRGASTASAGIKDIGNAAKATQAQLAALNKQALDTAKSVTEGYKGLGAALGMGMPSKIDNLATGIQAYKKAVADAARAHAMLGSESAKANAGIASMASVAANARREIESLYAAGKSVAESYKGLGAALGMKTAVKVDSQGAWNELGNQGKKQLEALDFANKMASASTSLVIEKQKALEVQLAKNAAGWKKLGDMGKRQFDGSQMAKQMASATLSVETLASAYKKTDLLGQGFIGRMKLWFSETTLGQRRMAAETEKASKKMVAAHEKVGMSIRGWLPHIRTAAASIGIYLGVRTIANIIKVADTFTEMGARLRLVSGNTQELARAQEGLFKIAQSNRAPLTDVVNLYFKLGNSMKDLGVSQKDVLQTVDTVGKAMRVSGASTIEISAAMQQLSQAFAKGKLDGDEFRSTMENAPRLMKALTDELGISKGELYKWSETGRLSVEKLVQAIKNQSGAIEQEFQTIPVTISGAWQQLMNAMAKYVTDADKAEGSSRNMASAISYLAVNFERFADVVLTPLEKVANGWKKIFDSIKQVRIALGDLQAYKEQFDVTQAIPQSEFIRRRRQNMPQQSDMGEYTTGGGFGDGGDIKPDFFNGINKVEQDYIRAAMAAWKLTDAQKEVVKTIVRIGQSQGFDPAFLLSIAKAETRLGELNKVSSAGAKGIFQFMDGTARRFGVKDPWNLEQAAKGASKYLSQLKAEFKTVGLAAAGYNAGEGNVRKFGGVPPFKETQTYVKRVLQNYRDLQKAMGASTDDMSKELQKAEEDQLRSYIDHLNARQSAFDNDAKIALAKQKTQMERMDAAQHEYDQQAKMAVASGDMSAIRQAEDAQLQFLQEKKRLLLESIEIEQQATTKRLALIGMEIAKAQGTPGGGKEVAKLRQDREAERAELAQLAERRKQIEIQTQTDITRIQQQFEDDRRKAFRQNADDAIAVEKDRVEGLQAVQDQQKQQAGDFVEMQRQRIEGLQAEFAVQKELANISAEAFTQYADQQRGAIDLSLERAKAEFENRDAQRQAMLEGKEGLDAIIQARENLNARLHDQLTLLAQERDATVQKLDLTRQELEYQKRLAEWQLQRTQAIEPNDLMAQLQAKKQIADIEAQIAQNIQAQAKANETLAKEQAKAQGDAMRQGQRLDTQEVKESQLRMNAFWDQYMGRLRDYASLWEEITGKSADGWSRMSLAAGEYQKQFNQISEFWKSDQGKSWGNLAPMMEVTQQAQAALAGMAKSLIALRSQYKEGSQAYKDMTSAAERMMEVQRVLAVVEGVLGVLHQLKSGDPYTAPARAAMAGAIVAMQLASIGMSSASVPGFSNRQAREASQAGGSTSAGGGVFGDTSAKSDSISKSLEIVSQNSTADLAYSAGMLRSLTNIELSMKGTTNAVIRGVGAQAVPGLGTELPGAVKTMSKVGDWIHGALFGPLGFLASNLMNKILGPIRKILFNVTKKITDWGIKDIPQTLSEILKGGFQALNYTEVTTTTKMLGITVSKKAKDYFAALDSGVSNQFTRVIRGLADSVLEAGKAFGLSGQDFNDRLKNFVVDFGKFSTKGLKGQELQDAISQMFSSMSDDMARAFMPGLDAFMQAGEGYFQTLTRVADGINRSTGILEQAGIQAINYQDIILKQGDVAAEIVRQSIVAFEGVTSAIGAYVDQAVGSAEELMAVYQDLLIISDTAKIAGFNMNNLSNALIVTSGGVSKFLENLSTYTTEILGGSDYARQMLTLTREFQKLGQAVPANNEAFVMLVDSIDTTTEAGQKLYAQILALAGAFSKAQQEAKRLEELRNKYLPADSMAGYRQQIEQVKKDFKEIIDGTLATLPGGPTYIRRTRRVEVLGNRRDDRQDDLDLINEDIRDLEAKGKLTQKEKQRLATLRQQRKVLNEEIKAIDDQIKAIEKLIEKNPKSQKLIEERAKLLEEQGDAIIKTLSDIWDAMTQAITAARETLKSINDSIFELIGGTGSEDMKLGMATARRVIAEGDYNRYTQNGGTDIVQLQKYADAYYRAIMDERDAKIAAIEAPMKALEKERDIRQKAHDAEISALEKQLGVAKELFDAVKGIQEYAKSLRTATSANLSPKKQLDATRAVYDELLAKAKTGDVEAMRKITGASDEYLEAARKYFGSGGKYGQIFEGIVSAMDSLGMTDMGDAQSIQDKIDQLNEAHGKYLDSIDKQIAALNIEEQIKAENDKTAERLKDLAKDLGPRIEQAEAQAKKDMADLIAEVRKTNQFSSAQLDALNQLLTAWGMDPIAGPAPANPNEPALPAPTDDWVQRLFERWNQGQTGYKAPLPAFANGGLAQPGWALVGEEGPELVKFGSQAQVFDADYTAKMLREIASFQPIPSQGSKPINLEKMPRIIDDIRRPDRNPARFSGDKDEVIAELRAMRTELKALVTTQSRANPAVIEQLANIERRLGYMERDQKLKPA